MVIDSFNIRALRIELTMLDAVRLPVFPSSEIRGMIFQGLKRRLCLREDNKICNTCPEEINRICQYPKIEAKNQQIPNLTKENISDVPPPIILKWPDISSYENLKKFKVFGYGEALTFDLLTLASSDLPELILSGLIEMGDTGYLGHGIKGRFSVSNVTNLFPDLTGLSPTLHSDRSLDLFGRNQFNSKEYVDARKQNVAQGQNITMKISTLLRLRKHDTISPDLKLNDILSSILRRIWILDTLYGKNISEQPFTRPESAGSLKMEYVRKTRKGRGGGWHPYGGIRGEVNFQRVTEEMLDILLMGELLHFGSGSTHGYGQVFLYKKS